MKRLFTLLLVVAATMGMQATGYVFTHTAKYWTYDQNFVNNGSFTEALPNGWANANAGVMEGIWTIEQQAGPNNENALMCLSTSNDEGSEIMQTIKGLSTGYVYVFSYKIKGEGNGVTSITANGVNYISLTIGETQLAAAEMITDSWQQMAYAFTLESTDDIVFTMKNLAAGIMVTDVQLCRAQEVFDTRIAERNFAYAEALLANEDLPNGKEDLREIIDEAKQMMAKEQWDDLKELMEHFDQDVITEYLNVNGANLMPTYLQDWTSWGQYNYSKLGTKDNWTFEGGRWGFTGNTNYLEFNEGDGYIASAGIQKDGTKYTLNASVRTRDDKLNDLPAGKYFFAIEAQAVAAANRANPYGSDHSVEIANPFIFIGTDTIHIEDVMSGYHWKTYYAIGEIKEGDKKVLGFHFPVVPNTGGRYSVRNPKAFLLGTNSDDMEFQALKDAFIVQQYNLNKRITEYPVELDATNYPWEQDSLNRAIAEAQPVYEASLLIIDADGNVLDKDQVTEQKTQELLDQVNALGRARGFVIAQNAPIAELKEAVAAANAVLGDPIYAGAAANKRQNLQAAVNAGQILLDNISSTNQYDAFKQATADILAAKEEFESTSANRANPTEILIKNGDFTDFSAGSNITSFDAPTKDWNWSIGASANRWEIRDNETLTQGHGASIWRGTTVALDGKVWQTIDLTYEGLYEYRAEAYISEERLAELVAAAQILDGDTIFTPNIRLFFGEDGLADSITISKWYNGVKADGTYFTRDVSGTKYSGMVYATYSVFFKKNGSNPLKAEFGFEALENSATAGANGFGFGNSHIYFLGDEAQYLADTKAEINSMVADAKSVLEAAPASYWTVKLQRYINDAEKATTAKEMQNAIHGMNEIVSRIKGLTNGLKGIFSDTKTVQTKSTGIFTIQGIKMGNATDYLKPGLYIINGKKVIK